MFGLFEVDHYRYETGFKGESWPCFLRTTRNLTDQLRMCPLLRMNRRLARAQGEKRHVG